MKNLKTVWSDDEGDLRKSKPKDSNSITVDKNTLCLELRRRTSGKGRATVEISNLPSNKSWNKDLAKKLKKKLSVGGAFKNAYIEVHGEKLEEVKSFLDDQEIKWKQVGG
ncbi:MAG: hypothetical protein AB8E15_13380 [Bdellovibrionales bacterium]